MLKYSLTQNNLTGGPDDYSATVQTVSTKSMDDVADLMISRGSTVTKAEVLSVLEEFSVAIMQLVKDGHSIVTPMFKVAPSISGVFQGLNDSFDSVRHSINLRINPGTRFKEVIDHLKLEKVVAVKPMPVLQGFKDVATGTYDDKATPGSVAHILGSQLRFDEKDVNQGIFFTDASGQPVRVETIVRNMPSELIFIVPAGLAPGVHTVSVRTILKGTKDVREGYLLSDINIVK